MRVEELVRANIRNLAPYSTARDDYKGGELGIFLDANESPYENGYNRYPDPHQSALKAHIAAMRGVAASQIFVGNGSDEAIDVVYRIFCRPALDNVISIAPTYGMYRVAADINDVEFREVQLREDFSIDRDAVLAAADENSRLLFLCSPNNPTGNLLAIEDVDYLIRHFEGVVVVDEAYIDFAQSAGYVSRLSEFDNLIVLQTLSKAWGMAALRLGLAFASEYIVGLMSRVKYPYNINSVAQHTVLQLLGGSIEQRVEQIVEQRERVAAVIVEFAVVRRVYPSDANFLLVEVDNAPKVYDALIAEGVIVRDRSRMVGCADTLRITIGTPEENRRLIEILKKL